MRNRKASFFGSAEPAGQCRGRMLPVLLFLFSVLVAALWFSFATSDSIRFDSDQMLYDRSLRLSQYRNEGRILLAFFLEHLLPGQWNPRLSGILFIVFFVASGWILTGWLFRCTEKKWPSFLYGLFFLLYGTSPVWVFQVYFSVQASAVALGMMLAACMAGADILLHTNRNAPLIIRIVFDLFLLLFCTALMLIYQSLVVYYLSVLVMLLFCRLFYGSSVRLGIIGLWAVRMILSLLLYVWIAKSARGGENDYLLYQVQWLRLPAAECLKDIAVEFGKLLLLSHSGHFSLYLPGLVLISVLLFRNLRNHVWGKRESVLLVLCFLALLLLPMAISIMEGSRPVPRTQFALQVVSAFLPLFFLGESKASYRPLLLVGMVFVLLQAVLVIRLFYTDDCRNSHDLETAVRITDDLESLGAEDRPLVLLGAASFSDDTILMEKTDVMGLSFFEWSYQAGHPGSAAAGAFRFMKAATGKTYVYPGSQMVSEAVKLAENMPVFPNEGYLLVTDRFCVIKLSEE